MTKKFKELTDNYHFKNLDINDYEIVKLPPLDYRIPEWNLETLRERNCPICNQSNSTNKYIRPDHLKVNFCNNCKTFFISPAPTPQQISMFYANYDKSHRRLPEIKTEDLVYEYKNINPLEDYRIKILSKHFTIANSKVLDVGFGRAQFLYSLKKLGAFPFGIELDKKAIEYAKALGITNVNEGSIEDMSNEIKFNLIIFNDLIEHPLNPMNLFIKANDLLIHEGLLLIITPNGKIADHELNPTTFRVDLEHMQYLTPQSCIYIANKLRLKIVHLETIGFPSLKGIDKPTKSTPRITEKIKKGIKLIPGIILLNKLLGMVLRKRKGEYHLFCIMQKSN